MFLSSALPRFILALCVISLATLYSATSSFEPYAINQAIWIVIGFVIMFSVSYVPPYTFYATAYPFYALTVALLIGVTLFGQVGMGARRWLELPFLRFQPTDLFRIAIIITLAKFFADRNHLASAEDMNKPATILIMLALVAFPTTILIRQPDLASGLLVLGISLSMAFLAGIHIWKFVIGGSAVLVSLPVIWHFLYEYQKKRILVFFNHGMDPRHAGYHVIQSKIAIGSGGLWGTGYLQGPQNHLNFLPEKHTDFIFTMFCEEWGFAAALIVILLYGSIIGHNYHIGLNTKDRFEQMLCFGIATSIFLYVFINIAMVSGLAPVVGIPLPFVSYGRTALVSLFFSQGIILSIARRQTQRQSQQVLRMNVS